jgi:phosphoribosyl 1,2-cyclic phosphodiesterase
VEAPVACNLATVEVTFFGVRGSCPCSGERYRRFGGNTSCLLVSVEGDPPLILDLGTGLRALGDALMPTLAAQGRPLEATALLTHLHFDHILGLPFFRPLHDPGARLTVYGPRQATGPLQETLPSYVQPPFFPVELREFRGGVDFQDTWNEDFAVGSVKVTARAVPHPGNTLGFRLEAEGRVVAYLPDHQAPLDRRTVTEGVLELCRDADLLVHDAQYTDEEFADKADWGHSTVPYAVRVAGEAGVRRLVLFHHDPAHDDRDVERMVARGRRLHETPHPHEISAAREGTTIDLGRA